MNILIFSAHPDDAEFAMGGTLALLAKKHSLTLCVLSDGSAGTHGNSGGRKLEQENAAKLLNAKLVWGPYTDCHIEYTRANVFLIASIVREHSPDVVFCPHWNQPGDTYEGRAHPDHRATGDLVRDAVRMARHNIAEVSSERWKIQQLIYYMVYLAVRPKIIVPIDSVKTEFLALLHAHKSQMQLRNGTLEQVLTRDRQVWADDLQSGELAEVFDADGPLSVDLLKKLFTVQN